MLISIIIIIMIRADQGLLAVRPAPFRAARRFETPLRKTRELAKCRVVRFSLEIRIRNILGVGVAMAMAMAMATAMAAAMAMAMAMAIGYRL